jgi:hypothetical protein
VDTFYESKRSLVLKVNNLISKASNNAGGSAGQDGFSGSIRPTSLLRIFSAVGLKGRSLLDLGAGSGGVLLAGLICDASGLCGYERARNRGHFLIYEAVLKSMEISSCWDYILKNSSIDLKSSLKPQDIDEVSYVLLNLTAST